MAYELNLTDEQYEAAYEINLDYLMAVNDYDDLYGYYWTLRNQELQDILFLAVQCLCSSDLFLSSPLLVQQQLGVAHLYPLRSDKVL